MSILIKGVEMPTSCRTCLYSRTDIRNVDWCVLTEKDLPCDCPIIPVPPHGRLIDADALPLEESVPTVMMHDGERWISAYELALAPTIIPAEEANDEA